MSAADSILKLTDRCVMCGLCLPHCPTYRLLRDEADSPRGRIALMQAVAAGKLEVEPNLLMHLDRCLACRACERMCPSRVEYGKLIDSARDMLQQPRPKHLNALLDNVSDIGKLKRTATAMRAYQRSGLQWLTRKSGVLKGLDLDALEGMLPTIPDRQLLQSHYPAAGEVRGEVGLFVGCIGSIMEGDIHRATIRLLNAIGYSVHVPKSQGCCGSLHQHNGDHAQADKLAQRNIAAFSGLKLDAIVSTASGCAAQLFEYESLFGAALPAPLYEVCDFLQQYWPDNGPQLQPQPIHASLHLPCTQRNILRRPDAAAQLLTRIPELTVEPLPGNDQCCGAAGSYMITQPELANALREQKLSQLTTASPKLLLSTNIGCALHLAAGLKERGAAIELLHPVELLARSLVN